MENLRESSSWAFSGEMVVSVNFTPLSTTASLWRLPRAL